MSSCAENLAMLVTVRPGFSGPVGAALWWWRTLQAHSLSEEPVTQCYD